jgi:hypothetical protein
MPPLDSAPETLTSTVTLPPLSVPVPADTPSPLDHSAPPGDAALPTEISPADTPDADAPPADILLRPDTESSPTHASSAPTPHQRVGRHTGVRPHGDATPQSGTSLGGGRRGDHHISSETRAKIDANIARKEPRLAELLEHIRTHGPLTSADIQALFAVSKQTARIYTHTLIRRGVLRKEKIIRYILP